MKKLFENTDWKLVEEESGRYIESFFLSRRGSEYSNLDKIKKIREGDSYVKLFIGDDKDFNYLRSECFKIDVIKTEINEKASLIVVVLNDEEIRSIIFEYPDSSEYKRWWNLNFDKDYQPKGFSSPNMSGPGWPLNLRFGKHVDAYQEYFDELKEHYPQINKALKRALDRLKLNGLDHEETPGSISISLKK